MNVRVEKLPKNYIGLAHDFWVNPDSCSNCAYYERYLRYIASTDYVSGKGTTHVIIDADADKEAVIGFITLKAASLISDNGKGVLLGRPAIEIAELAVDKRYERKGFGRQLIDLALVLVDEMRQEYIGIEYLVACADPMSEDFYIKMEFTDTRKHYEIPRENWNIDCIPMMLRL